MFRLRALRRACQKHSFLFNPLAARPVKHRGDKARVYLCFEQDFFLPMVLCRQLAEPRKGRREGGILLPALMLLVVLAWVNRFTPHQYKHWCWRYQRLLVHLFVWESPSVSSPRAECSCSHPYGVTTQICPIPHTQDAWSAPRKYRHSERNACSETSRGKHSLGLVIRLPQQKGAVAQGVSGQLRPQPVCTSHRVSEPGAPGLQNQVGWTSLSHRCFIIKLNILFNRARFSQRG